MAMTCHYLFLGMCFLKFWDKFLKTKDGLLIPQDVPGSPQDELIKQKIVPVNKNIAPEKTKDGFLNPKNVSGKKNNEFRKK